MRSCTPTPTRDVHTAHTHRHTTLALVRTFSSNMLVTSHARRTSHRSVSTRQAWPCSDPDTHVNAKTHTRTHTQGDRQTCTLADTHTRTHLLVKHALDQPRAAHLPALRERAGHRGERQVRGKHGRVLLPPLQSALVPKAVHERLPPQFVSLLSFSFGRLVLVVIFGTAGVALGLGDFHSFLSLWGKKRLAR